MHIVCMTFFHFIVALYIVRVLLSNAGETVKSNSQALTVGPDKMNKHGYITNMILLCHVNLILHIIN